MRNLFHGCEQIAADFRRCDQLLWRQVFGFCGQSAQAATYTWDNSGNGTAFDGGSSSWSLTGSNWWNGSSDLLWSNSTDTAAFGGSAGTTPYTVNVDGSLGPINVGGLIFQSQAYTLTGGTLNLTNSPTSIVVNASSGGTIASVLTGTGGLPESGAGGAVTLSGANTYAGGTTVTDAADATGLVVANASALGTGPLVINGKQHFGVSVMVNSGLTISNSLTLTRGQGGTGAAYIGLGAGSVWSGPITVNNTATAGYPAIWSNAPSSNPSIVSGNIGYSTLGTASASFVSLMFRGSGGYQKVTGQVSMSTGYVQLTDTSQVEFDNLNNSWGTLDVNNAGADVYVGAANALAATGIVYSSAGGTLKLNNIAANAAYSQTIAGLSQAVKVTTAIGSPVLTLQGATNYSSSGVISGGLSLVMAGPYTQTLFGANTYTGSTTVNGGMLLLSFGSAGAPANNILNNTAGSSGLFLGGGTLEVQGKLSTANSQRFNGLTVNTGVAELAALAGTGGTLNVSCGSITRNPGGYVDFTLPATGAITTTNANGLLGTWATVGGANWATVSGGSIAAYSGYTSVPVLGGTITSNSASNVQLVDAGSTSGNVVLSSPATAVGTLMQSATSNAGTIALSGGTLQTGALMVAAGAKPLTVGASVGDGVLTVPAAGGELALFNYSASNNLTINSVIADSSSSSVTKLGGGTAVLTAANTYAGPTRILLGTLQLGTGAGGSDGSIGSTSGVLDSGTLAYKLAGSQTASYAISGIGGLSILQGGLTLTGTNSYAGGTTISGGTLQLGNSSALGAAGGNLAVNGVLDLLGNSISVRAVSLTGGAIQSSGGPATLTGTSYAVQNGTISVNLGDANGSALQKTNSATTVVLLGNNSYTGGTTVSGGTLQIGNGGTTGGIGAGNLTLAAGTTLDLNLSGAQTVGATAGFTQFTFNNNTTIRNETGNTTLQSVNTTINSSADNGANYMQFNGTVNLAANNGSTLTLATVGSAGNSGGANAGMNFAAGAVVNSTGNVVLNASAPSDYFYMRNFQLNGNTTFNANSGTLTINTSGQASNSIGFFVLNPGTAITTSGNVVFNNNTPSRGSGWSANLSTVNVNSGTLTVNGNTGNGMNISSSTLNIAAGAALAFGGSDSQTMNGTTWTLAATPGNLAVANSINMLGPFSWAGGAASSVSSFSNVLSGAGDLNKNDSGLVVLSANNSYTGNITISAGTLQIAGSGSLGGGNYNGSINNSGVLVFNSSTNLSLGGQVYGTGNLIQQGPSTLLLSGYNSYGGGTTISAGTLQLGSASALPANGTVTANGGVLDLNGNGPTIGQLSGVAGVITDNSAGAGITTLSATGGSFNGTIRDGANMKLALTAAGPGTLTLGGFNTYTGPTNVNGGALVVNGTHSGGDAYMIEGGTLAGAGSISGTNTVTLGFGTTINPGPSTALGSIGTLTLPNLVSTGGATANFDLAGTTSVGGGVNDLVAVTGNLSLTGNMTVSVNPTAGTLTSGSAYTLFTYGTLDPATTASGSGLQLASGLLGLRQTAAFNYGSGNNSSIQLTISGFNANLTWIGTSSTTWDQNNTSNLPWTGAPTPSGNYFATKDNVTFNNSAVATTVNIAGTVSPGSVTVTGSKNFVFTGAGNITNGTSVKVLGPGTLTIANTNDYTLGTFVQGGGKVILGTDNGLPIAGTVTLGSTGSNGTLDLAGYSQTVGGLSVGAGATAASQVITTSSGSSTLTYNGPGSAFYTGSIQDTAATTGGTLALAVSNGLLNLSGNNTFTGGATLTGGTLQTGAPLTLQNVILTPAGRALDLGGFSERDRCRALTGSGLCWPRMATLSVGGGGTSSSFAGTLSGAAALDKVGSGTFELSGGNAYTGGTILNNGTLVIDNNNALGSGTLTINGGTLDSIAGGVTLANNPQSWNGDFAFNGTQSLDLGTGAVTLGSSRTVTVNANTLTVDGNISGNGDRLTLAGSGVLALTGFNAFGSVSVNSGTLQLAAAAGAGSAPITVNAAGSLYLSATGATYVNNIAGSGRTVVGPGEAHEHISRRRPERLYRHAGNPRLARRQVELEQCSRHAGSGSDDRGRRQRHAVCLRASDYRQQHTASTAGTTGEAFRDEYGWTACAAAVSGPVTLFADTTIGSNSGSGTFSNAIGEIGGSYGLTKLGGGAIYLTGQNSYSGVTTVSNGAVDVRHNQSAANGGWAIGTDKRQRKHGHLRGQLDGSRGGRKPGPNRHYRNRQRE